MEILRVTFKEYEQALASAPHCFNEARFNELNRTRAEDVHFLLFRDSKVRLGCIFGVRNGEMLTPFSAPFGGFTAADSSTSIQHLEQAFALAERYAEEAGVRILSVSLPPLFYEESFLTKQLNVLYRRGYSNTDLDLDFYIDLAVLDEYDKHMWRNARKNLRVSMSSGMVFRACNGPADMERMYSIIRENREYRQKPLNLSLENILRTAEVVRADFFLVSDKGGLDIASAVVFHANNDTLYVPLWGDKPGHGHLKPMNFLSYHVFENYRKAGKKYVHIGISTEHSAPNYGLCEFKESLGCTVTPKFTFRKSLR